MLLFTVPRTDLKLDFFRVGGHGGQKGDKTDSGCRITHIPSGAVGQSRDERYQSVNRKLALQRLVASKLFKSWVRVESARIMGATDVIDGDYKIEFNAGHCIPGEVHCDLEDG